MVAIVGERPHRWRKRGAARLSRIGAFDAISGHRQLFHRTAQRALINLAIKDAIAGEESFGWKRITAPPVAIPTGAAVFPKEIITPVRKWMESRFSDIRHWSDMSKGDHFAAFEQPVLFVEDVRRFFRPVCTENLI
jgi:pimeloyl-ACP methyl ester carboxylesterase